ncbi:MAG TPA: LLM class flavin-dependent oxidoreductase, partial [Bradyrhizobium sp.]|nr:LLM class flavin-dependent oxidoreductase [Bradyrhizobium sp.]
MPVKIIGMIGTQMEGVAVHLIKGKISREFVIDFTRLHEQWDYDSVLVGYYASAAEGFGIALYAADHTERIKFLIAHRPGSVAPALAARQIATFDQLTQGRMSLHVIAGTSDQDQASEGDFLPKHDRYRRAGEYLDVMRRMWTSDRPFDHHGEFYRLQRAYSDIKPHQLPYPPLFFGGSSDGALQMGAEHCDVFAIFGEPLAETQERVDDFRRRAARFGRQAKFNMSLRTIMAASEGEAWDKAQRLLADIERKAGEASQAPKPSNHSSERLLAFAARGDVHDERLWMGIARATGAPGNTSCLVGTAEQIASAVLRYYRLGIHSFLLR